MKKIKKMASEKGIALIDATSLQKTEFIPTGFKELDDIIQGFPRGRITEIYGPVSVSKTTLTLSTIANFPKGLTALFIDVENSLDAKWVQTLGIKPGTMVVATPLILEDAVELILEQLGKFDMIVVDSVAAALFKTEDEKDVGEYHVGVKARLMTQAMRKIIGPLAKTKTALIFINQEKPVIGIPYGSPFYTPGGRALEYAASMRIRLTSNKSDRVLLRGARVGKTVKAELTKNKVGIPDREAKFQIFYASEEVGPE